jgi:hypothetical protein
MKIAISRITEGNCQEGEQPVQKEVGNHMPN